MKSRKKNTLKKILKNLSSGFEQWIGDGVKMPPQPPEVDQFKSVVGIYPLPPLEIEGSLGA